MVPVVALVASCPLTLMLGSVLAVLLFVSALVSRRPSSPSSSASSSSSKADFGKACRAMAPATGPEVASETKQCMPGPRPFPIIGSLHILGRYEIPYEGFVDLKRTYGDLYQLRLGSRNCVVVNTLEHMKEVLVTKGAAFGGRPDFLRYHILFGGDRDNSLALCDWSNLQKTRRSIVHSFIYPKKFSEMHAKLGEITAQETDWLIDRLAKQPRGSPVEIKDLVLAVCANIFTMHFCSKRFEFEDKNFQEMISHFDSIFYDINQGYAVDFIPWLSVFHRAHFQQLRQWSKNIRQIILKEIVAEHESNLDPSDPRDFVDVLLTHLANAADDSSSSSKPHSATANTVDGEESSTPMDWQSALYELEDLIGGHSAIGNLFMRMAVFLERDPEVVRRIRVESDAVTQVTGRPVTVDDRHMMPYTEAVMLETLRIISSPIVPHVATENTSIDKYFVEKGSVVFLNNYELNTSEEFWERPQVFDPSRFVRNGRVSKPEHFIPFSTGRRACMGHKIVQNVTFLLTAKLFAEFDVRRPPGDDRIDTMQPACLAVPPQAYQLVFTPRKIDTLAV